jgi:NADH-quinone oxidoreductase subunit M
MEISNHILSINIFSPLIGIFIILIFYLFGIYNSNTNDSRLYSCFGRVWPTVISLIFALMPLFISSALLFEKSINFFHFKTFEKFMLIKSIGLEYSLEIDGPSVLLMILSSFSTIISLIIFWQNKSYSSKHTILGNIMLLMLQICCLGVFSSKDMLLFYIFFEASLIPMIFIIGIWGGENKVFASLKLFIYTIFGSLFFLFSIIYLKIYFGTTDPESLKTLLISLNPACKKILWLCLFVAFAIKIPMIPFHTWLPDAHVQAPTFGSIMLAAILIKMGAYAMMKFLIPILPETTSYFAPFVSILSIVAIIYGSFICIAQKNLKKLVAYSSVAHMGYVSLGLFSPCGIGYAGAVFQMISHGFISSALFYSVGIIYEKFHSLEISKIHSLSTKMPFFAFCFMIFTLGSVGLPGTSGFVGEFLVIINSLSRPGYMIFGILAATGVIFGAVYMLILYKNIFFRHDEKSKTIGENIDINSNVKTSKIENTILLIFVFLIIFYGIRSSYILSKIENIKNNSYINCNTGNKKNNNINYDFFN